MMVNWRRALRRRGVLEQRTRRTVAARLYRRELHDGCVLLRAALRQAGIDPATHEPLRRFSPLAAIAAAPDPVRHAADLAFAAADPLLARRQGFAAQLREHLPTLPPDGTLPARNTLLDWVAWAVIKLRESGAAHVPTGCDHPLGGIGNGVEQDGLSSLLRQRG